MTSSTLPVAFRNTILSLIDHNGEPYVAMRPVVEGMGLEWGAQASKLRANGARWGVSIIDTPSGGGTQQANCIPLRKLPGWLSTISPNRVKPALREAILAYQRECDDVLWRHWNERRLPPEGRTGAAATEQAVLRAVVGQRWLVYFDTHGAPQLTPVPPGAVVVEPERLASLIEDPGSNFRRPMLADIIAAAARRLAGLPYQATKLTTKGAD